MTQLSLTAGGEGWYRIRGQTHPHKHGTWGFGWSAHYPNEAAARIAGGTILDKRIATHGNEPACLIVEYLETPPLYARRREEAWRLASSGVRVVCNRHGLPLVDGNREVEA